MRLIFQIIYYLKEITTLLNQIHFLQFLIKDMVYFTEQYLVQTSKVLFDFKKLI